MPFTELLGSRLCMMHIGMESILAEAVHEFDGGASWFVRGARSAGLGHFFAIAIGDRFEKFCIGAAVVSCGGE